MIGHGCTHEADTGTWRMFQLDGELFFGCQLAYSSWDHARKHNYDHPGVATNPPNGAIRAIIRDHISPISQRYTSEH
jgi:hypothetical protein